MKEIISDLKKAKEEISLTKHKYILSLIFIFLIFISAIIYLSVSDAEITGNAIALSDFSSYSYFGILFVVAIRLIFLIVRKGFHNSPIKRENEEDFKEEAKEELEKIKRKFEDIEKELIGMMHKK